MFSNAWLWMYAGMILMLLELAAPGFVVFFFGLAALTVGTGRFVFGEAFTLNMQIAAFSVFSVLYLILLRRWLKSVFMDAKSDRADLADEYVGRCGRVTAAICPPSDGRVVIGDSEWSATAETPVSAGVDVVVVSRSNLTLKVRPKSI
jgi:membrane protein implicated in regulation of membrane protease activity